VRGDGGPLAQDGVAGAGDRGREADAVLGVVNVVIHRLRNANDLDAKLVELGRVMSALVKGCYELVPIPDPKLGPRKLDVATLYNTERYRPMYANKRALPVFLQRAS
jgi:hypothetical protein